MAQPSMLSAASISLALCSNGEARRPSLSSAVRVKTTSSPGIMPDWGERTKDSANCPCRSAGRVTPTIISGAATTTSAPGEVRPTTLTRVSGTVAETATSSSSGAVWAETEASSAQARPRARVTSKANCRMASSRCAGRSARTVLKKPASSFRQSRQGLKPAPGERGGPVRLTLFPRVRRCCGKFAAGPGCQRTGPGPARPRPGGRWAKER